MIPPDDCSLGDTLITSWETQSQNCPLKTAARLRAISSCEGLMFVVAKPLGCEIGCYTAVEGNERSVLVLGLANAPPPEQHLTSSAFFFLIDKNFIFKS